MSRLSRPPRVLVALTSFCSGAALASVIVILGAAQAGASRRPPPAEPVVLHVVPAAQDVPPCGDGG